jgi:hypothetical protein
VAGVEAFGVLNPNDFSDEPPQFTAANEDFHDGFRLGILPERGPPQGGDYPDRVRIFIVDTMT